MKLKEDEISKLRKIIYETRLYEQVQEDDAIWLFSKFLTDEITEEEIEWARRNI